MNSKHVGLQKHLA